MENDEWDDCLEDDMMEECDECVGDAMIEYGNVADGVMTLIKKPDDKGSPYTISNAKHTRNKICINMIICKEKEIST